VPLQVRLLIGGLLVICGPSTSSFIDRGGLLFISGAITSSFIDTVYLKPVQCLLLILVIRLLMGFLGTKS